MKFISTIINIINKQVYVNILVNISNVIFIANKIKPRKNNILRETTR